MFYGLAIFRDYIQVHQGPEDKNPVHHQVYLCDQLWLLIISVFFFALSHGNCTLNNTLTPLYASPLLAQQVLRERKYRSRYMKEKLLKLMFDLSCLKFDILHKREMLSVSWLIGPEA
jgi:hypothetical protein